MCIILNDGVQQGESISVMEESKGRVSQWWRKAGGNISVMEEAREEHLNDGGKLVESN
jgi:hypothetical protein